MGIATTRFFERIGREPAPAFLERGSGTLRFDLRRGSRTEHWLVSVGKQGLTVTHGSDEADCVMACDAALFDQLVEGEENTMAALLRGVIEVRGRAILLIIFQRLFAPPDGRDEGSRRGAGYARRQS